MHQKWDSTAKWPTTGRPITEKTLDSLRIDQKMMLVLEKNLENNSVAVRVLGLVSPSPLLHTSYRLVLATTSVDASSTTTTMATQKRLYVEPSGPTKKRRRTARQGKGSLLETGYKIKMLIIVPPNNGRGGVPGCWWFSHGNKHWLMTSKWWLDEARQ
jgi:hypothetical protein